MQPSSASGANNQEQHLRAQLELLKHHDAVVNARDQRNAPIQPAPPRSPNGYDDVTVASQDVARAIVAKSEADSHIHPDLRAHRNHGPTLPLTMMPIAPPSGHSPGASGGPSAPALAPAPQLPPVDDGQNDGRKAKRELSQSKRAAQNRAAQRAFRQRKEGYIKKLEQQVRDYMEMEQTFKNLQSENYVLRDYVVQLQSRLLDVSGEFPQPPPNVNLTQPPAAPGPSTSAPETAPDNPAVGTPLEAVAQAVAGLAAHEQMTERQQYGSTPYKTEPGSEDTRSADEINRHLQPEGGPSPAV